MGYSIVLNTPALVVLDAHCATTAISGPEEVQGDDRFEALFVRAGCFTLRDARGEVLVDPTTCVLGSPRQFAEITHPITGGDTYLQVQLSPDLWHQLTSDEQVPLSARVSGQMQVAGRAMLTAGHRGVDAMTLEEEALNLVAAAMTQAVPTRMASGRPSSDQRRRRLAEDARTILISDPHMCSVGEVATLLECSPFHLSRVFRAYTGMTLAGYRTQLRVNFALQLLSDGGTSIADAALQSGFADQAHLSRVIRDQTSLTPSQIQDATRPPKNRLRRARGALSRSGKNLQAPQRRQQGA